MTTVRRWFLRIQQNDRDLQSRPIPGCPKAARTAEAIQKVQDCLNQDSRQTVREIGFQCNLSKDTVHRILTKELKVKRIASRFVRGSNNIFWHSACSAAKSLGQSALRQTKESASQILSHINHP